MKHFTVFLLLLPLVAISGCVSTSKAKAQARAAFQAGRQQVLQQQIQAQTQVVLIRGDVKNPVVPWKDGLSLANAILAAEYQSRVDPREIVVTRKGESFRLDPNELLHGADMTLEPGDVVDILR